MSKKPKKIRDFGEQVYKLRRTETDAAGHRLIEHDALLEALREQARGENKGAKQKAVQAIRYARRRLEGLVDWSFDTTGVDRKNLITWTTARIQPYFTKQ